MTSILSLLTLTLTLTFTQATNASPYPELTLTLVNNCPYTLWPAIQPNAGHPILQNGGFILHSLTHRSFRGPDRHWSGRIWARTGCTTHNNNINHLTCQTGDCGGRLECNGAGGTPPATLAQFSLHHSGVDLTSYAVSLVDGFNVPLTVTPHEGYGVCPVVGCKEKLLYTCPRELVLRSKGGQVVACRSACEAFGTDEFCCRNHYNSPQTCRASSFSEFFKKACPSTFTYAHDSPSLMHECSSPKELKVIFCH
ncbi:hypothetical protein GIB67_029481 [Kingdonia uniflora]|uniref:Osmotin-like protein n=1 Tax=Kingdonia uniflora TaxID=39325 RepID=A0A7J7NYA7_9MAGN|nr:hypothetical protein GIB67_029481 [Kingdonia uniflora]